MPISFNEVPNAIRTPFVYVEIDGSQASTGPSIMPYKGLIFGQMISSGAATADEVVLVTSADKASQLFGQGSMLHRQFIKWFDNNPTTPVYAYPFEDPSGSNKATGSVTFGGTADVSGTLSLYIAGERIQVGVTSGDTMGAIATATVNAIQANKNLPVTAEVNGDTAEQVDITAKNAGPVGNEITIEFNVYDEETPGSINTTISAMSSGSGVPDFSDAWAALGDEHYNVWVTPYTDSATLTALESELEDRNSPLIQRDAVAFGAMSGTVSTLQTFGDGRNSRFVSIMATQQSVTPAYEFGAAYAAVAAYNLQIDPARPLQTLKLDGVIAPRPSKRYTQAERNILLFDGVASCLISAGNVVLIERAITMYQENALGADDTAYLDVNTIYTLSYLRYDFRNFFLTKFPRHKLANDGTKFGAGQAIITPKTAKAECIRRFIEWERIGLVENVDQFKNDLIVERNASDPNRLDFLLPPNIVNQARIFAAQIQYRL
ncbi:MAG: phage tail protein [Rickettsiales bacterium]|nr:phage tail protein [Rickettsiales bacterium]